uniref:Variant surface glycoprotein 1125.5201 n=1 Tax=Trypanosoma brucei TaxID=5691 RepID=A0A1J0RBP7_9TRYP|nr:variant surface glycoprotein 1125.5201 [Trypanosoma brucei]
MATTGPQGGAAAIITVAAALMAVQPTQATKHAIKATGFTKACGLSRGLKQLRSHAQKQISDLDQLRTEATQIKEDLLAILHMKGAAAPPQLEETILHVDAKIKKSQGDLTQYSKRAANATAAGAYAAGRIDELVIVFFQAANTGSTKFCIADDTTDTNAAHHAKLAGCLKSATATLLITEVTETAKPNLKHLMQQINDINGNQADAAGNLCKLTDTSSANGGYNDGVNTNSDVKWADGLIKFSSAGTINPGWEKVSTTGSGVPALTMAASAADELGDSPSSVTGDLKAIAKLAQEKDNDIEDIAVDKVEIGLALEAGEHKLLKANLKAIRKALHNYRSTLFKEKTKSKKGQQQR